MSTFSTTDEDAPPHGRFTYNRAWPSGNRTVGRLQTLDDEVIDLECPGQELDLEAADVHRPLEGISIPAVSARGRSAGTEVDGQRRHQGRRAINRRQWTPSTRRTGVRAASRRRTAQRVPARAQPPAAPVEGKILRAPYSIKTSTAPASTDSPGATATFSIRPGLVVVEAMKMENELRAPRAGRIEQVAVAPGLSVDAGAVLVLMEQGARRIFPSTGAAGG